MPTSRCASAGAAGGWHPEKAGFSKFTSEAQHLLYEVLQWGATVNSSRWFVLSDHAKEQMEFRGIAEAWDALNSPDEVVSSGENRNILQKVIKQGDKPFLLRMIVEKHGPPYVVVTVYKTSKIEKYRSIQ